MKKAEILKRLESEVSEYANLSNSFDESSFFKQPNPEKWSAAQNLQHLVFVSKKISDTLKNPSVLATFGSAERPSRDYETVEKDYQTELEAKKTIGMPYRYLDTEGSKLDLIGNLAAVMKELTDVSEQLSEEQLDTLQMPHPLLGLMTVREWLHFTASHTKHHLKIVEKLRL